MTDSAVEESGGAVVADEVADDAHGRFGGDQHGHWSYHEDNAYDGTEAKALAKHAYADDEGSDRLKGSEYCRGGGADMVYGDSHGDERQDCGEYGQW